MTAVALGTKNFSRARVKAVNKRKRSGELIASRSDRLTEMCFFSNMVTTTTMNEVNRDKTKVPD